GNVREAEERLRASLDAEESREGHMQLGLLLARTGQNDDAAVHLRRALDLTEAEGAEGSAQRAELLEQLGDAFRYGSDRDQAQRMYRQSLDLWRELLENTEGPSRAIIHVRIGVLHSRLGEARPSSEAFGRALTEAPNWREPYAA